MIWIASYPKSGNTWLRIFLQNLAGDSDKPININDLSNGIIASSRYWIDSVLGFDSTDLDCDELDRVRPAVYRWTAKHSKPESFYKIHDAYSYTSDGEPLVSKEAASSAIYLVRNPLDVCVSLANHMNTSVDKAISCMNDSNWSLCDNPSNPSQQVRQKLGSWSEHVESWMHAAHLKVNLIRYEDMKNKPEFTFSRIVELAGLNARAERIKKAIKFSDISELTKQESETRFRGTPQHASCFFRKGEVGDWRRNLSSSQVERLLSKHEKVMKVLGYN